jgi:hypothetical protein
MVQKGLPRAPEHAGKFRPWPRPSAS